MDFDLSLLPEKDSCSINKEEQNKLPNEVDNKPQYESIIEESLIVDLSPNSYKALKHNVLKQSQNLSNLDDPQTAKNEELVESDYEDSGSASKSDIILFNKGKTQKNPLKTLFSILDSSTNINGILAGYFSEVVISLLKKDKKFFFCYIYYNSIFKLLNHSANLSICKIIQEIMSINEKFYFQRQVKILNAIYQELLNSLDNNLKKESLKNLTIVLLKSKRFVEQFFSFSYIKYLIERLIERYDNTLIEVLQELYFQLKEDTSLYEKHQEIIKYLFEQTCNIFDLSLTMLKEIETGIIPTTNSNKIFNSKLIDFYRSTIKMNSKIILRKLLKLDFVKTILNLFSKYPNNCSLLIKILIVLEEFLSNLDPKKIKKYELIKVIFDVIKELNNPCKEGQVYNFKVNKNNSRISPSRYYSYFLGILITNLSQDSKDLCQEKIIFEDEEWKKFQELLNKNFIYGLHKQIAGSTSKTTISLKTKLTISKIIKIFNKKSSYLSNISEIKPMTDISIDDFPLTGLQTK